MLCTTDRYFRVVYEAFGRVGMRVHDVYMVLSQRKEGLYKYDEFK